MAGRRGFAPLPAAVAASATATGSPDPSIYRPAALGARCFAGMPRWSQSGGEAFSATTPREQTNWQANQAIQDAKASLQAHQSRWRWPQVPGQSAAAMRDLQSPV